jgi:hypothetical protein
MLCKHASKSLRLSGCRDRGFTQSYKHGGSSQKRPATHTNFNVSETAGIIPPNCNIETAETWSQFGIEQKIMNYCMRALTFYLNIL